jgi:hypothetical protein
MPNYEQGSYGLLSAGDTSQLLALPVLPPDANGMEETGAFTLNPDGSLTGNVNLASVGPEGADLRLDLKYSDEKERRAGVERMVARDLPGVTLDSLDFVQPSDLEKPLEIHLKVTVPQYAHNAGPLLLVRPRVVGDDAIPFDDRPRIFPINLDATGHWHDSFDITLPAGYVIDDLPDPVSIATDFGSYHSTVTAKGNVLHFDRELVVKEVELPADKAAEFRKFESTILFDEKSAAVLKKQPAAAGGSSKTFAKSVAELLVDYILEWLTVAEPFVLLDKKLHCFVEPCGCVICGVRRDEHVVERPYGIACGDRLVFKNVKAGAADLLAGECANQGCLINHRPTANIDHNGRGFHGREFRD